MMPYVPLKKPVKPFPVARPAAKPAPPTTDKAQAAREAQALGEWLKMSQEQREAYRRLVRERYPAVRFGQDSHLMTSLCVFLISEGEEP